MTVKRNSKHSPLLQIGYTDYKDLIITWCFPIYPQSLQYFNSITSSWQNLRINCGIYWGHTFSRAGYELIPS